MDNAAKRSVFIETYGCQMNVLDSELVRAQLESLGYSFVNKADDASVVLLNTCSVRALSEQKVWSQLGRLGIAERRDNRDIVIGVLGCMAEREGPTILKRMPHVDIVCGPSNLDRLPALIDNAMQNLGAQVALSGHTSRRTATLDLASDGVETLDLSRAFSAVPAEKQAYVRITRGCNKFCSFCVVPYTRGPEVHRPPQNIIDEVARLVSLGVMEVTLLGQTVNHYTFNENGKTVSFADLLWRVHEANPALPRLRFLTSYPRDFGDDALDVMKAAPRICRYLHIPAQSGSNRLLRLMNRGYTVEEYKELLHRARERMPDIRIAGDMIVGFPTETDEDHQASIDLLRYADYKGCFIFKYSPRPGTVATRRLPDDVPDGVKKARNLELLEVTNEIALAHHQRYIGQTLRVLVEYSSEKKELPVAPSNLVTLKRPQASGQEDHVRLVGRTEGDEIVAFNGPKSLVGSLVDVKASGATTLTIFAELETHSLQNAS